MAKHGENMNIFENMIIAFKGEMQKLDPLININSLEIPGQVLCDEVKIVKGIGYNSKNGKIVGIMEEQITFENIKKQYGTKMYIEENKSLNIEMISQWYYRVLNGNFSYPILYFPSVKGCNAVTIAKQFLFVVKCLESCNFKVESWVGDAGGK